MSYIRSFGQLLALFWYFWNDAFWLFTYDSYELIILGDFADNSMLHTSLDTQVDLPIQGNNFLGSDILYITVC